jgi:hypothetical protein
VDLAGVKLALVADWPGNFHHGNGKARLYFDPAVSAEQQTAIRAIFEGGVEGPVPAMWSAVISEWLSPSVTEVNINWDQNTVSIAGVGESTMTAPRMETRRICATPSRRWRSVSIGWTS